MNLYTATEKIKNHPPITHLIFGFVPEDGDYRIDVVACCGEENFEKEKIRFVKFRKFTLKEV
jgi:hypothetical protein